MNRPCFRPLLPALALLVVLAPVLSAQDAAVKLAKQVYAEVNAAAKSYQVASQEGEDADGFPLLVKAWSAQDGTLRKMETVRSDDHGSETTEFYYSPTGELVFAFQMVTTERVDTGKVVSLVEHRYYFDAGNGAMVQWLDPEKKPVSLSDPGFGPQQDLVLGVEAQSRALFPNLAASPAEKVISEGKTVGVFQGIEQGDYFYLRLAVAEGEERSFMILQTEGLLHDLAENPDGYVGQKLIVQWQEKVIHIPEAGGNEQVTVCVRVARP